MKYCKRCLYTDTKPDLSFNADGVCSACVAFELRSKVDWDGRRNSFREVTRAIRARQQDADYDCVVPVSGGKDSHYQIIKALEYGMRPLAVTATTDALSDIGRHNLNNIARLGVDHIEVTTDPLLRRRINKFTLMEIGDISWAEHVTIFTIPVRMAVALKIPCILWGENPQNEYGGPERKQNVVELDAKWLAEFGGLNGLRVEDVAMALDVNPKHHMAQYLYPAAKDLDGLAPLFLGHFFPWDGEDNAKIAVEHGFQVFPRPIEGSGCQYENLDNVQVGIHDRGKFIKYGFGRATDIACNRIRRGRITREEGITYVKNWDNQFPHAYLGIPIEKTLSEINMSMQEYKNVEAMFANKELFDVDGSQNLIPKFEVK